MNTKLHNIIVGQILGDAHLEKVKVNSRMSFSFGSSYLHYGNWIHSLFSEYCSKGVYPVTVNRKEKVYTNYRLKTKTLSIFNEYHNEFYQFDSSLNKYTKIIPSNIIINPQILAHFIMGDGNYYKDGRIRIYTNYYTYDECVIIRDRIRRGCELQCEVLFDRIGKNSNKQYIITIGKSELRKVQTKLRIYMHNTMMYRIGLLYGCSFVFPHPFYVV